MSKSTKIIAGLGVAAALGVAALPMASFAVSGQDTVTVSGTIDGAVTITMEGDTITSGDVTKTGTVAFGTLVAGNGEVASDGTTIEVETNQPYGYTFSALAADLQNTTSTNAKIEAAGSTNTEAITDDATFGGSSSIWGITVAKSGSDTTLSGSVYNGTNYRAVKTSTVIDDVNNISGTVDNTYTMTYGIGTIASQAAGEYSGDMVYTVTCAARS